MPEKKKKILAMLDKGYSISYIAFRLKVTGRYVRKIRSSIVPKKQKVPELKKSNAVKKNGNLRLHSNEYNLKILRKSLYYEKLRSRGLVIIKGMKLRLFRDSIEIYDKNSYFGNTTQECLKDSLNNLMDVIKYIENDFHITIIKDRYHNIKHVKSHYSEINNEIATDYISRNNKIILKKSEDNKVWFVIDNSFNFKEMETVHPETAKQDMDAIKPMLDSLREHYEKHNESIDFKMILFLLKEMGSAALTNTKTLHAQGNIITSILNIINPGPAETKKPGYKDKKDIDYIH